jgi:hypothetical protein
MLPVAQVSPRKPFEAWPGQVVASVVPSDRENVLLAGPMFGDVRLAPTQVEQANPLWQRDFLNNVLLFYLLEREINIKGNSPWRNAGVPSPRPPPSCSVCPRQSRTSRTCVTTKQYQALGVFGMKSQSRTPEHLPRRNISGLPQSPLREQPGQWRRLCRQQQWHQHRSGQCYLAHPKRRRRAGVQSRWLCHQCR